MILQGEPLREKNSWLDEVIQELTSFSCDFVIKSLGYLSGRPALPLTLALEIIFQNFRRSACIDIDLIKQAHGKETTKPWVGYCRSNLPS